MDNMLTYTGGKWCADYDFKKDLGLRRAESLIEVMEARRVGERHVLFLWDEHYERLIKSCEGYRIPLDKLPPKEEILVKLQSVLMLAGSRALGWIIVTKGPSFDFKTPYGDPTLSVDFTDVPLNQGRPFRLKTVRAMREFPELKLTAGYGYANMHTNDVCALGFDKFLYWSEQFGILEGAFENIVFITKKGELLAPNTNILYGVTRKTILELAKDFGMKVTERPVHNYQLDYCDEAFLASTTLKIAEVVSINEEDHLFKVFPENHHTQILQQLFLDYRAKYFKTH